ncbi:ATP-binding protein [Olivibacter ginsenosidimutans]|uniref:ATP-binding protein n=1 Tax=Olivibacter ginsenosidimutans TaxID=1176537 RepID=A0ABP9BJG6_9SPHI
MINKANVTNASIESAGLPKDYKQAIAEYIWNGFDAKASSVRIHFKANKLGYLDQITIEDNGEGIPYETLHASFGNFLDSLKKRTFQRSSYTKGKKGKGRFSFSLFATRATWRTVYRHDNKLLAYQVMMERDRKDEYEDTAKKISKKNSTGTSVTLAGIFGITASSLTHQTFFDYLAAEFGWFLFLNKDNGYTLSLQEKPLDYSHLILEKDMVQWSISGRAGNTYTFKVTYLRWSDHIGDKYYYYYLNSDKIEVAKDLTSYNNNAIDFHHSVYVESSFFDAFDQGTVDDGIHDNLFSQLSHHLIFKKLNTELKQLLHRKQKKYIKERAADEHLLTIEKNGSLPHFSNNRYDQERKKDLLLVVKELYCVQPKILKGLKQEQEKTFIGFLNLLLDTDERENILTIVEQVTRLSTTEREELCLVLKKTNFSRIVETIKLIENRFKVIELLRTLVFDLKRFTTERDHIQRVIEENYWLFGEQYHLASADKHFEYLLSAYLFIIDGIETKQRINYHWKRRPDIFLCRKNTVPDRVDNEYQLEENIMVELKRPTVTLGKEQLRQVDDYLDLLMKEDQFNSQTRTWKFYLVSNKIDAYMEKQYAAFKDKGKKFLVHQSGRYEIFALTWDDLFRTFEIKHNYLLDKLEFDKNAIQEELQLKNITLDRSSSDKVASQTMTI